MTHVHHALRGLGRVSSWCLYCDTCDAQWQCGELSVLLHSLPTGSSEGSKIESLQQPSRSIIIPAKSLLFLQHLSAKPSSSGVSTAEKTYTYYAILSSTHHSGRLPNRRFQPGHTNPTSHHSSPRSPQPVLRQPPLDRSRHVSPRVPSVFHSAPTSIDTLLPPTAPSPAAPSPPPPSPSAMAPTPSPGTPPTPAPASS